MCLSDTKYDLNSVMLKRATRAAFALSTMMDNTASATTINKLFNRLIEPILLCGVEQWPIRPTQHLRFPKHQTNHRTSVERHDILSLLPPYLHPNLGSLSQVRSLPYLHPRNTAPYQVYGIYHRLQCPPPPSKGGDHPKTPNLSVLSK